MREEVDADETCDSMDKLMWEIKNHFMNESSFWLMEYKE